MAVKIRSLHNRNGALKLGDWLSLSCCCSEIDGGRLGLGVVTGMEGEENLSLGDWVARER